MKPHLQPALQRRIVALVLAMTLFACNDSEDRQPNVNSISEADSGTSHQAFQSPNQEATNEMFAAYLSPDLDQQLALEHIDTFNSWINARAIAGKMIHPQLGLLIGLITQPDFKRLSPRRAEMFLEPLRQLVLTYTALDREPGLFGTLKGRLVGPGFVDSFITVEQTFTVGSQPMGPDAGFILPNHFRFAKNEYQTEFPAAANYASIQSSNPQVRFVADTYMAKAQFSTNLRGESPRLFFRITEGELQPEDTVTVTLGDRSGGSPGLRSIHWTNSAARFPLWILLLDEDGNSLIGTPPEVPIKLVGLEAVRVKGFGPATATLGDAVIVTIRAEDKFRNLATSGFATAYRVFLNDEFLKEIRANSNHGITELPIRFDSLGIKRLRIESTDGSMTGRADPILVQEESELHVYFGETHGHSGFAEGMGEIDAYFEFARYESRLDFTTLSEHDLWMDAGEWYALRDAVEKYNAPGVFTTLLGYEWTVEPPWGGHHNVLYRDPKTAVYVPRQEEPELDGFWKALRASNAVEDVIAIPHAHQPGDWLRSEPELERLVEVVSYHGTFEWFGRRYLDNGFETGLIGSSDDHIGHPGYRPAAKFWDSGDNFGGMAAVFAESNNRDGLFDAMRDRYTYATNGARMILHASMNGQRMGTRLAPATQPELSGTVYGTAPIASITLIRNGKDYRTIDYSAPSEHSRVLEISFKNSSDPIELRRISKPRTLVGQIEIDGATVTTVRTPVADALNVHTEGAVRTSDSTVGFKLRSRGRLTTVEIDLDDIQPGAGISVSATLGPEPELPLSESFDLQSLRSGPLQRLITFDRYRVTVTARLINRPLEPDREFSFIDDTGAAEGTYYYLRVRQTDGGLAYSSPWWIGAPAPNENSTLIGQEN